MRFKPFWQPQSAILLPDPPMLATPSLLRAFLRPGKTLDLLYAGDRMWPAIRHGQRLTARPAAAGRLAQGSMVLCCPEGIPDVLRVERRNGRDVRLRADADPGGSIELPIGEIIGIVEPAVSTAAKGAPRGRKGARRLARPARRLLIDLDEAIRRSPDPARDGEETVLRKYELQAPFYSAVTARAGSGEALPEIAPSLFAEIRSRVRSGGRILVAGSGSGRECFGLAREGWAVTGVDFSPAMVEAARRDATRQELTVLFEFDDLREHREPAGSLAAILFTYDVYSFLPSRDVRIALLSKMARWLEPGGIVFLSARLAQGSYGYAILSLQWIAHRRRRGYRWGHSHSRWISPEGVLCRSFVAHFTTGAIRREAAAGGFEVGPRVGGHVILSPR